MIETAVEPTTGRQDERPRRYHERLAERLTHKLRNPLSVITTAASQLEFVEGKTVDEDDVLFARSILLSADALNEVLTNYMLCAGEMRLKKSRCDLIEICRKLYENGKNRLSSVSDKIYAVFQSVEKKLEVELDGDRIKIAIGEILKNSIEELSRLQQGRLIVIVETGSKFAKIRIIDSGDGFVMEQPDEPFIPFVTTKPGKSGLGLAIARRIVELHGGTISVNREKKDGAEVIVSLPIDC